MTRRRWIADEVSGDRAFLLGRNAEHLSRVLRARVGQHFEIATPDGVRLGEIVEIAPERVTFSTRVLQSGTPQPSKKIHVYLAIFKFDRLEWALEKCTELGVNNIVPIIARRTDSHLAIAAQKRAERWRRIAHEAAQQCRRENVPEIANPEKLGTALVQAPGRRIVLSESECDLALRDSIGEHSEISLAVGPEGGWTEAELRVFTQNGWTAASLGPTILRAETAAIAAVAIAMAAN